MSKTEEFLPFKWDPSTVAMVALDTLARALGPISATILRLSEVDREAGSGRISPSSRCLWTRDGRRIEIAITDDGVIGSISKEPDPLYPGQRVTIPDLEKVS